MKILSIDVGIKNLAICLLNSNSENNSNSNSNSETDNYIINIWNIINLAEKTEKLCTTLDKNNIICNKPAKYIKDTKCYCLKHAKKCEFLLPSPELKVAFLNKQKIQPLLEIAAKHNIIIEKHTKRADIINKLNEFCFNNCFQIIEKQNSTKVDLVTIGRNIHYKFDEILGQHITDLEMVIIENQIGPLANKMKTLQGMICQYFIMKNENISIEFVNAGNKLKDFIEVDAKTDYKQRKQLGIQKCSEIINNNFIFQEWVSFFNNHQKKDDLADSFLQGIWFIKHKILNKK